MTFSELLAAITDGHTDLVHDFTQTFDIRLILTREYEQDDLSIALNEMDADRN